MGFASYGEYLASDLWASIRGRVLERDAHRCVRCRGTATQVHHANYSKKAMHGECLDELFSVCRPCHEYAEFEGTRKTMLFEANRRLGLTVNIRDWTNGRSKEQVQSPRRQKQENKLSKKAKRKLAVAARMRAEQAAKAARIARGKKPRPGRRVKNAHLPLTTFRRAAEPPPQPTQAPVRPPPLTGPLKPYIVQPGPFTNNPGVVSRNPGVQYRPNP